MADVVMLVTAVRPLHVVMSRAALSVSEGVLVVVVIIATSNFSIVLGNGN